MQCPSLSLYPPSSALISNTVAFGGGVTGLELRSVLAYPINANIRGKQASKKRPRFNV